jgi:regulatory protein
VSEEARAYALRLLSQRSYTNKALRDKLIRKEFSAEETDAVLVRLAETGLIDDAKFALNFARSRLTATSASPRRIRQLLMKKGIAGFTADDAISKVVDDEQIDVTAALERVARRKLATMSNLDPVKVRQRLFGFLCRRGYDVDDVRSVMKRCLVEID